MHAFGVTVNWDECFLPIHMHTVAEKPSFLSQTGLSLQTPGCLSLAPFPPQMATSEDPDFSGAVRDAAAATPHLLPPGLRASCDCASVYLVRKEDALASESRLDSLKLSVAWDRCTLHSPGAVWGDGQLRSRLACPLDVSWSRLPFTSDFVRWALLGVHRDLPPLLPVLRASPQIPSSAPRPTPRRRWRLPSPRRPATRCGLGEVRGCFSDTSN